MFKTFTSFQFFETIFVYTLCIDSSQDDFHFRKNSVLLQSSLEFGYDKKNILQRQYNFSIEYWNFLVITNVVLYRQFGFFQINYIKIQKIKSSFKKLQTQTQMFNGFRLNYFFTWFFFNFCRVNEQRLAFSRQNSHLFILINNTILDSKLPMFQYGLFSAWSTVFHKSDFSLILSFFLNKDFKNNKYRSVLIQAFK